MGERERNRFYLCEWEKERKREHVWVGQECIYVIMREKESVHISMRERKRECTYQ